MMAKPGETFIPKKWLALEIACSEVILLLMKYQWECIAAYERSLWSSQLQVQIDHQTNTHESENVPTDRANRHPCVN